MSSPNQSSPSRIGYLLAGGALVVAGYFAGNSHQATIAADNDRPVKQDVDTGVTTGHSAMGVSIPNGGAALVKGKDGMAYIVDSRGVFVRASQSGKGLELP